MVRSRLLRRVWAAASMPEPSGPKHNPYPVSEGGVRYKIALVGGRDPDHAAVKREVGDMVDLRCFEAHDQTVARNLTGGGSHGSFKDQSRSRVLLWTDHVSHGVESALKGSSIPYERISGNLSTVVERAQKLVHRWRAQDAERTDH
jgi:hypothetical protein